MIKDNKVRDVIKVERVIDGDTIIAWINKGDYEPDRLYVRFLGINTPERSQDGYYEAKEYVSQALEGQPVSLELFEDSHVIENMTGFQKGGFNRSLANVWVGEGEEQYNLNERLLELGLAKVYK